MAQVVFEGNITNEWKSFAEIIGTVASDKTYRIQNRGNDMLVALESTGEPAADNPAGDLILVTKVGIYKKGNQDLYLRAFNQNCSINVTSYSSGEVIVINNQDITVTENGVYTADEGYTGLGTVTVEVTPTISTLAVTPSTSAQTFNSAEVDGYKPVTVSAVTSSIDANIVAGNIKDGVTILGVTGDYTGGGASTRFGLSLDNFVGTVTNGTLGAASSINGITFTGVTDIADNALSGLFYGNTRIAGAISFPDLTTVSGDNACSSGFNGTAITSINLSSLTTVSGYGAFYDAFQSTNISGTLDLSALTTISGYEAFSGAFTGLGITSVDLSALTTVGDNVFNGAFEDCLDLVSIDLSAVTTVGDSGFYHAFMGCGITGSLDLSALTTAGDNAFYETFQNNAITSIDVSSLATVGENGLYGAFARIPLVTVTFPALNYIAPNGLFGAFGECWDENNDTTITSISFPALTSNSFEVGDETAFDSLVGNDDGVTVHFPSNLQAVIGNWASVTGGFGGTNTTVLFDLTATE